ncbi:MAG: F-type H+-transporting ATPase subunit epsilon [Alphaproteobacteria bacterium]|jgi:F-type H+-transporting ATPase subunit epsilon
MRLLVTTPISVVVDEGGVSYVRAEDETGAFGVLPGHADFVTALSVSVITWRNRSDEEHHVALRGGVLMVRDGNLVEVATREAVGEDTLQRLGGAVLTRFREEVQAEAESRISATRLHLATIRQLQRYLEAGRQLVPQGSPTQMGVAAARGQRPETGGAL